MNEVIQGVVCFFSGFGARALVDYVARKRNKREIRRGST